MVYIQWQDAVGRQKRAYPKIKAGKGTIREGATAMPDGFKRTTLFMNGRSQAVRLPKEFRFEGTHVLIRKEGNRVILTSEDDRWEKFLAALGSSPDFPDRDQGSHQVRPELDAWIDASD
jgi:antitoxin VapB